MAGYSSSDLNLTRGASGEVKSYYLGLYTTWLDAQSGYHLDSVVKFSRFDNDLSGSRGELGVGVAMSLMDRLQVLADFDYSNGKALDQPWGVNLGVHYSW